MFRLLLGSGQEFGLVQGITLVAFFALFVGILIWAIFAKKHYIKHMSQLPLNERNSQ